MKRQIKKLALNRETLLAMEEAQLGRINGGSISGGTCYVSCPYTEDPRCLSEFRCTVRYCY